jgi:hypothetical protein
MADRDIHEGTAGDLKSREGSKDDAISRHVLLFRQYFSFAAVDDEWWACDW